MTTVVTALDAEIAALEGQLAKNAIYRKLQHLKNTKAMYEAAPGARKGKGKRKAAGKRPHAAGSVTGAAREVLAGVTEPMPTRDVLAALQARGITVGGAAPHSTLSALLSKSPHFTAHGRSGWTLAEGNDGAPSTVNDSPVQGIAPRADDMPTDVGSVAA